MDKRGGNDYVITLLLVLTIVYVIMLNIKPDSSIRSYRNNFWVWFGVDKFGKNAG